MSRIKQSVCFNPFTRGGKERVDEVLQAARELGYVSVEMAPREYWDKIKDMGFEIAIVGGHKSLPDGLNKLENHDRIEDELLESIELAKQYGIPSLITFSGNREGKSDVLGLANCVEGLRRVIKAAEEAGINLCMELLNSKVNHPDYQCDHTEWGVSLCRMVDSPRCKLLFDIYHMQIMEGDLIRNIRDNIQYIGHFHTAGNPDRKDLDDQQEIYYPAVMRAIAETGYDGYVGHEFRCKGDVIECLKQTFETCDV